MAVLRCVTDWDGAPGEVVTWAPTPECRMRIAEAPSSDIPPSYQQESHTRGVQLYESLGLAMARLFIPAWEMPGQCDIPAMTTAIHRYLRRHDTYLSWTQFTPEGTVGRRSLRSPDDIELAPVEHGTMTSAEWQALALETPGPLEWDCFRFGIIQRNDTFSFFAVVDHIHLDGMFMNVLFDEVWHDYDALTRGVAPPVRPPAALYDDYCIRQRRDAAELTRTDTEVLKWVEFLAACGGGPPLFPLPLGDPPATAQVLSSALLTADEAEAFDNACRSHGARTLGGLLACAALTERDLAGVSTYRVITPTTTRATAQELATTGWYTGVVPVTVPVEGVDFSDAARVAQQSFYDGRPLAHIPLERVLELIHGEASPSRDGYGSVLSFLDVGRPPLDVQVMADWEAHSGRLFMNAGALWQVNLWVNRGSQGLTLSALYPDTPIARESITAYTKTLRAHCLSAATA